MSEQLKPTIENPFAKTKPGKKATPLRTKDVAGARTVRPAATREEFPYSHREFLPSPYAIDEKFVMDEKRRRNEESKEFNPGYFVSAATKTKLRSQLEVGAIIEADMPSIYEISEMIAKILDRTVPSLSDFEVGIAFRNREHLAKIVAGEVDIDIVRRNNTQEVLARSERVKFWREVARIALENLPPK